MNVPALATRLALVGVLLTIFAAMPAWSEAASGPDARVAQVPDYQVPAPTYLTPFPVVRMVGRISGGGVRIKLLTIRSPAGSRVTLRCLGGRRKGCRFKSRTKISPRSRLLRFRELERRTLKAGARVVVFVRRGDAIGKYTSFRIRRGRAPVRSDACLLPDDPFEPAGCP